MSQNRRYTPKVDVDWWVIEVDTIKKFGLAIFIVLLGVAAYFGVRFYLDYRARVAGSTPDATAGESEGPERTGYFIELEGDVKVKKKGSFEWVRADRKIGLNSGDLVKTGSRSSAHVLLFDGTEYTIKSESLTMIQSSVEDPQSNVRNIAVRVSSGAIDLSTAKKNRPESTTELSSPSASTQLGEMTQAGVSYNPESLETNIQIYRGSGEVVSGGETLRLSSLQGVTVNRSQQIGPTVRILPPPDLIDPANLKQLAVADPLKELVLLSWREVSGAKYYHLLLSDTALFSEPAVDFKLSFRDTSVRVSGLAERTYFWKVAAIDQDGREGQFSRVRRFRVITASLQLKHFDVDPPKLSVDNPQLSGNIALVRGKTEPGVLLTLNGEQVSVDNDGGFFHPVILTHAGKNELVFVAQDTSGNESRLVKSVYAEFY